MIWDGLEVLVRWDHGIIVHVPTTTFENGFEGRERRVHVHVVVFGLFFVVPCP